MNTKQLADEIVNGVIFAKHAHIDLPKTPADSVRFHDYLTPYIVHPIWCAMTLLTETSLDEGIRFKGYQALMWHDTLEDTFAKLPDDMDPTVRSLILDMTFDNFQEEKLKIWQCSKTVRLLKLYDKASNLLDASHMSQEKWNVYVDFVTQLIADVEINFGSLNIVKIAKAIAIYK
jgi:hypothetical protein